MFRDQQVRRVNHHNKSNGPWSQWESVNDFTKWKQERINMQSIWFPWVPPHIPWPHWNCERTCSEILAWKTHFWEDNFEVLPIRIASFCFQESNSFCCCCCCCLFILDASHCLWGLSSLTPEGPDVGPLQWQCRVLIPGLPRNSQKKAFPIA